MLRYFHRAGEGWIYTVTIIVSVLADWSRTGAASIGSIPTWCRHQMVFRLRGYCVTLGSCAHLCTTTWRTISIETVSQQSSIMDGPIGLNMMTPWPGSTFCIIDPLWGESSGRHRFPSQRAVMRGLDGFPCVSLTSCWTNNRVTGDSRRGAHGTSPFWLYKVHQIFPMHASCTAFGN